MDNGVVWAIDGVNGRVLRIDPVARQVIAVISVDQIPEQLAVGP
ncbi:MAG: hypothetical protein RMK99_08425 [Anaerolineales bacterium]|nr:hypothetical protein [Anaerolineales bacterium]